VRANMKQLGRVSSALLIKTLNRRSGHSARTPNVINIRSWMHMHASRRCYRAALNALRVISFACLSLQQHVSAATSSSFLLISPFSCRSDIVWSGGRAVATQRCSDGAPTPGELATRPWVLRSDQAARPSARRQLCPWTDEWLPPRSS